MVLSRLLLVLAVVAALSWDLQGSAWVAGAAPRGPRRSRVAMAGKPKDGIFSPAVGLLKGVMGEDELKKMRAKIIQAHGSVMGQFIETSDSAFGQWTLKKMFEVADEDGSGELDKKELRAALQKLGFEWMDDEKQIDKVVKKGDKDDDGLIDFEEFKKLAPTMLKQNLMKLAKENGGELGMLS